jgi:hypothetical protein
LTDLADPLLASTISRLVIFWNLGGVVMFNSTKLVPFQQKKLILYCYPNIDTRFLTFYVHLPALFIPISLCML